MARDLLLFVSLALALACDPAAAQLGPAPTSENLRARFETALEYTQRLDDDLRGNRWLFGDLGPMSDLLLTALAGADETRAQRSALLLAWNRDLLRDREELAGVARSRARGLVGAEGDVLAKMCLVVAAAEEPARRMLLPSLGLLGDATPRTLAALAHAASCDQAAAAWRALWAIGWLPRGPASGELVPVAAARMRDRDPTVRLFACWALARIAPEHEGLVPELSAAARPDGTAGGRRFAAMVLESLGARGGAALADLVASARDPRHCIPEALRAAPLAAAGAPGLDALAAMATSDSPPLRHEAFLRLARLGPAAKAAAPALLRALTDTGWFVREPDGVCEEGRALASIDPDLTLQVLVPRLSDVRGADYAAVLSALGPRLGPAAKALVAQFRAARDPATRLAVARVLAASGPAGALAVAGLTHDLRARPSVECLDVLARIGPAADPALPEVQACLDHESEAIRAAAERALRAIAPEKAERR